MRIAIFTESYAPVINGVASAVRWLAAALREEHEVVVYAPRYPGHREEEGEVVRLPSYRPPRHRDYPVAYAWTASHPGYFGQFARRGFDVVHTHSPFTLGQVGRRWARRARIPVVTTYHTLYVEYSHYGDPFPPALVRAGLRTLSRAYCNACDAVAVPTGPIREVLLAYGVRRPISVIPTGLPPGPSVAPDPSFPRAAFGIDPATPLVLYAGRLAREKNLELLFAAFARVAAANPRAHLFVAGSGPCEAEARAAVAAARLEARVTFAGFIPPERMRDCYAAADVLAFTSLTDTQGLVITEAKAAGLPVVSVADYGPATVVRDGIDGFLVPNDPEAFSTALLRLLDDPETRARFGAAALQDADRFRIETTAARYLELYESARGAIEPQRHRDTEKPGKKKGANQQAS
jgi:1,2-diacylglycerol 3-alpha-glucosyltransferase